MALIIGSENADSGMSLAIYAEVDRLLSPPLQKAIDDALEDAKPKAQEALNEARKGWKKLSYSIAKGVIEHIKSNMEIRGIKTQGDVKTTVEGKTNRADPGNHQHDVDLSGEQIDVLFTQSNDGTGLIR